MTTTRPTLLAFTALALGVLGALTGCGGEAESEAGKPTATSKPSPTTTLSATPSASPTPSIPVAAVASCDNLVNASTRAAFTSNNLAVTPPADFAAKLASEGNYLANFFTSGGILCQVAGVGAMEASEMYGWAPFVEANSIPIQQGLTNEGWSVAASSGGVLYSAPAESGDIIQRCLFSNTEIACAITDARLAEVLANAPS